VRLPLLSRAGDTLEIEALAERRLADEYDAAQERSDVFCGWLPRCKG
jgi:hypothetical protein